MKCELCKKADAETAITRGEGENAEELYVCKACAKAERLKRQKKSQRTRKATGMPPGMSVSITQIGPAGGGDGASGEDVDMPLPAIGAFMGALKDMVDGLANVADAASKQKKRPKRHVFPVSRVEAPYRIGRRLHLEGLHLIGELTAVRRAMHALEMDLVGVSADGINDVGHAYELVYDGSSERVKRVLSDLLREERNARVRLFEELPRVFGDSLCRALAVLKNCRLLSPGELFDLLSPLRLAAKEEMLEGISLAEIEGLMAEADLTSAEDKLEQPERDRVDAERADEMNARFEEVVLNERAEEKFL